ncbi:MAG TPA: DUF2807 domain-containing protein, partial [Salinivirgaceae bacterium]|nr:DUF2807 domain-containing protein [Salinivirgaceae bacterium]
MKESNKILLSALSLVMVAILVLMAIAKNMMTGSKYNHNISDSVFTKIINPQPFQKLELSGAVEMKYSVGTHYKLVMEADSETIARCVVDNNNGTLIVKLLNQGWDFKDREVSCHLIAPVFSSMDLSAGASLVSTDSLMNPSRFEISTSAGASADLIVFADTLTISASAGSELRLKGKATQMRLDASAGSEINAKLLQAVRAKAFANSGSDIVLTADEM